MPDRTFPYYPFIGFSTLETNLANVAGTYNQLGYHEIPSQNYARISIDSKITINADGTWQECDNTGVNAGKCQQAGSNFAQSPDGSGAFVTNNFLGQGNPTLAAGPLGKGYMIVGKLRGQNVPILVRTGTANATITTGIPPFADDESGISMMSPQISVVSGSVNGEYVGVDNAFDYRTTALSGTQATLIDPFQPSQVALSRALNLDYTECPSPGLGDIDGGRCVDRCYSDRQVHLLRRRVRLPRPERPDDTVFHHRLICAVTPSGSLSKTAACEQRAVFHENSLRSHDGL